MFLGEGTRFSLVVGVQVVQLNLENVSNGVDAASQTSDVVVAEMRTGSSLCEIRLSISSVFKIHNTTFEVLIVCGQAGAARVCVCR